MGCSHTAKLGIALILLASAPSMAQDRDVKVKGRVVDRDGKPVAGGERSPACGSARGWVISRTGSAPATTDDDGRFTVKVDFYGRRRRRSGDRLRAGRSAALAVVPAADARREVEIRLVPLVRVHGKLESKDLGRAIPWTNVYINLLPGKIRVLQNSSKKAEFSMLLPPGEYDMNAYGSDVTGIHKPLYAPTPRRRRPRPGHAGPAGHLPRPPQGQGTPRLDAGRRQGRQEGCDARRLSRQVGPGRLLGPLVRALRPATGRADRPL